jgi:hypothetical protein
MRHEARRILEIVEDRLATIGYVYGDQPLENFLNPGEERLLIDFEGGIPGVIAGAIGGSDVAADSRIITSGIVRIGGFRHPALMAQPDPSMPPSQLATDPINAVLTLIINFEVRDTVGLCPGQCGSLVEQQLATIELSRLEATGLACDVPPVVNFSMHVSKTTRLQ